MAANVFASPTGPASAGFPYRRIILIFCAGKVIIVLLPGRKGRFGHLDCLRPHERVVFDFIPPGRNRFVKGTPARFADTTGNIPTRRAGLISAANTACFKFSHKLPLVPASELQGALPAGRGKHPQTAKAKPSGPVQPKLNPKVFKFGKPAHTVSTSGRAGS
jgi:hypothetical protein